MLAAIILLTIALILLFVGITGLQMQIAALGKILDTLAKKL